MQLISDYCTEVTTIVHETDIEKSVIHNHLSDLIEKIIALYGGALLIK